MAPRPRKNQRRQSALSSTIPLLDSFRAVLAVVALADEEKWQSIQREKRIYFEIFPNQDNGAHISAGYLIPARFSAAPGTQPRVRAHTWRRVFGGRRPRH
jgi:hypothetical protein